MSDLTKTLPPLTHFIHIFVKESTGALRAQLHGRPTSGTFRLHQAPPKNDTATTAVRRSGGHFAAKRSCVVPWSRSTATAPASAIGILLYCS
jgi:hypothetical protein